jgi:hypothetical protein
MSLDDSTLTWTVRQTAQMNLIAAETDLAFSTILIGFIFNFHHSKKWLTSILTRFEKMRLYFGGISCLLSGFLGFLVSCVSQKITKIIIIIIVIVIVITVVIDRLPQFRIQLVGRGEQARTALEVANESAIVVKVDSFAFRKVQKVVEKPCVSAHDVPVDPMDVADDVELEDFGCLWIDNAIPDES